MKGLRKKGIAAAFCKDCDSCFLSSGRRAVDQKQKKAGLCQSMDCRLVYITRIQVPPRPPKRQSKGCLFFCQYILAKTAKIPVFPMKREAQGLCCSFCEKHIRLQLFPSISVDLAAQPPPADQTNLFLQLKKECPIQRKSEMDILSG